MLIVKAKNIRTNKLSTSFVHKTLWLNSYPAHFLDDDYVRKK
jgi:hypothetical protein